MAERRDFLTGLVVGGLLGVALGLILAPASGRALREKVKEKGGALRDEVKTLTDEVVERFRTATEEIVERARTLLEQRLGKAGDREEPGAEERLGEPQG
jgi:gas vesicle protein